MGEPEVGQLARREDVHVQVRHLQPGDDQARARCAERLRHRAADPLRHRHEPGEHRRVEFLPLIDLRARYHQRVALGHRFDRQECDELVVGVDESAGQFAVDDPGEDGGHGEQA